MRERDRERERERDRQRQRETETETERSSGALGKKLRLSMTKRMKKRGMTHGSYSREREESFNHELKSEKEKLGRCSKTRIPKGREISWVNSESKRGEGDAEAEGGDE